MEDITRNCPGVWQHSQFSCITPQHVATEKGPHQGVVATKVLHDDIGNPYRGTRVA
jgi:hypothetical protein